MFGYKKLKEKIWRVSDELGVVKEELKSVCLEVKQAKCVHKDEDNFFEPDRLGQIFGGIKKCKECGEILCSYGNLHDFAKAKAEFLRKEEDRLFPRSKEENIASRIFGKEEILFSGDYIKKVKGRWVHERTGRVLKVKK